MRGIFSITILWMMILGFSCVTYAGNNAAEGERLSRSCAGCHGTAGASPGKVIPIIGGQVEKFLKTSLAEFTIDKRPGDVMRNLAKGYTAEEQSQIAAYFVTQPWVSTPHAAQKSADASLVSSCKGCHGSKGEGRGSSPRLAGQHPDYLYQALMEYKQGERPSKLMKLVKKVDDARLKQMADYYSSLK